MEKSKLPNILCKYYKNTIFLEKALKNNEIYFAPLGDFNDPFETLFAYDENEKTMLLEYPEPNGSVAKFEITSKEELAEVRRLLLNQIDEFVLSKIGIACFTIDPCNQLMWSHYTDNHKGVCLMYNLYMDADFFKPIDTITYKTSLPKIKNPGNKHLFINEIVDILFTKSKDWEYEKEYRVQKTIGVHQYNPKALSGIVFGSRMNKNEIEKIIEITKPIYPGIDYFFARPSLTEYKIDFYDLDNNKLEVILDIDFESQTNKSGPHNFCVAEYGLDCICTNCKPTNSGF